jgi:hypothetical protein
MLPAFESYQPSRLFVRVGWAASVGSVVCLLCGLGSPFAFIPAVLCILTACVSFWLAVRPTVRVSSAQLTVGERAIAWREIREINGILNSPLIIRLKLTNNRRRTIICPSNPEQIARLSYLLRKHSYLASFDGVSYRDYWTWFSVMGSKEDESVSEHPIRMVSREDELEIERLFRKLKTMRSEDAHSSDDSTTRRED